MFKNRKKDELFDKIILRLILIVVGALVFGFSPFLNNLLLVIIEYIIGMSMVVIGMLSLIVMLIKKRRGLYGRNNSKL